MSEGTVPRVTRIVDGVRADNITGTLPVPNTLNPLNVPTFAPAIVAVPSALKVIVAFCVAVESVPLFKIKTKYLLG